MSLTKREKEVLGLLAQGYNNEEIANILTIKQPTVATFISNIYSKLFISEYSRTAKTASMRVKAALYYIKNYATEEFIQELRGE